MADLFVTEAKNEKPVPDMDKRAKAAESLFVAPVDNPQKRQKSSDNFFFAEA